MRRNPKIALRHILIERAGMDADRQDARNSAGAAGAAVMRGEKCLPGTAVSAVTACGGVVAEGIAGQKVKAACRADIDAACRGAAGAAALIFAAVAAVAAGRGVVLQNGVAERQRAGIEDTAGGVASRLAGAAGLTHGIAVGNDQTVDLCSDAGIDDEVGEVAAGSAAIDSHAGRRGAGLR